MYKIFLGGTCNDTKWREELIPLLTVSYFNPVVDEWTDELKYIEDKKKEISEFNLYVFTPSMTGVFSIAELIQDSNKNPDKTLFMIIPRETLKDGTNIIFEYSILQSLEAVADMAVSNGAKLFTSLESIASFINNHTNET